MGSHLTTAIRQIQTGKASPKDIEELLRGSLERLKLIAREVDGRIPIEFSDNGRGLEGEPRNGMRGMRERDQAIGVGLRFENGEPGMRMILDIPA